MMKSRFFIMADPGNIFYYNKVVNINVREIQFSLTTRLTSYAKYPSNFVALLNYWTSPLNRRICKLFICNTRNIKLLSNVFNTLPQPHSINIA